MLFLILFTLYQATLTMLVAKVLMEKINVSIKDCLLAILTSLIAGGLFHYILDIWFLVPPLLIVLAVFYVYKLHHYTLKKAIIISTTATLIILLLDYIVSLTISIITGISTLATPIAIYHIISHIVTTILFAIILTKTTKKIRNVISENEKIQTFLIVLTILVIFSVSLTDMLFITPDTTITFLGLNFMFLIIYFVIAMIIFHFYSKTLREKYEIQKNQEEQETLRRYTQEIELQSSEMRKFKHDYQNILVSLNDYIEAYDYDGLRAYYSEKIKPTAGLMNEHEFQLEPLANIKIREIKSILAMKLMIAQDLGFDVNFDAKNVIEHLSLNSVILVRSLGILLDNAIEELTAIGGGNLFVGILKEDLKTTFIVQNKCRTDVEKVHKLREAGFTIKGENRGIGLNNLAEFAKSNENMFVETTVMDNQFIQKIIIIGG